MILISVGMVSAAETYKWTDENGVVHYSDKIPPSAQKSEKTVLDKQGREIKRIESAAMFEQRQRQAEEDAKKQAQQRPSPKEYRDRALLFSYLSEEDIDLARDRALVVLDAQAQSMWAVIAQLEERQKSLLERKGNGEALPEGELESVKNDLSNRRNTVRRYMEEKSKITKKYDEDKKRWRELKAMEKERLGNEAQRREPDKK
ncbi:MAG: DUF4124 domain-containing protein [Burkholderiales bacterium]|nr:DUF4124 domain-containing protein [Burkholderiales bacterium]